MRLGRRPVPLCLLLLLTACGGNRRPLGTIEPVPGSRTREGGEIVPLDSARAREIRPLGTTEHEIAPIEGEVVPVDATRWQGTNYEGELTLEFLIGGILRYTAPSGTWTNGTWHQAGNTITFEMNSHFADYTGRIRGPRMSGTAHDRHGRTWDWQATRQ